MELHLIPLAVKNARETFAEAVGYGEMIGDRFPRAYALFHSVRFIGNVAVCAVVGHKLIDNGYAGPDSGCIDVGCARCGFSYGRTVLY